MTRKIRIRRTAEPAPEPSPEPVSEALGFYVGTRYLVQHYSAQGKWVEAELKKAIISPSGSVSFTFYIQPPGWVTVTQDRIKHIPEPTTRKRKKKSHVIED